MVCLKNAICTAARSMPFRLLSVPAQITFFDTYRFLCCFPPFVYRRPLQADVPIARLGGKEIYGHVLRVKTEVQSFHREATSTFHQFQRRLKRTTRKKPREICAKRK